MQLFGGDCDLEQKILNTINNEFNDEFVGYNAKKLSHRKERFAALKAGDKPYSGSLGDPLALREHKIWLADNLLSLFGHSKKKHTL